MLRIAICEENKADINLLFHDMDTVMEKLDMQTDMDCFSNGEDLITAIRKGNSYDLLLLDIYLGPLNRIETARIARELLPEIQIVFLASSREFAFDAFELDAIHYLLKPVSKQNLVEVFHRFFKRVHRTPEMLKINTGKKIYPFPLTRVQKIQSNNKGVDVYLQGIPEPWHIPISFIRVEEQIDPRSFLRISRGLLVHNSYIQRIDKNVCYFCDGTSALISRREKSAVRKRYNDYLLMNSQEEVPL